jgi:hypothetical protein
LKSIFFITPELKHLDRTRAGVLALFRFKEMRPLAGISSLVDWRLHGHLSRLIIDGFFKGDAEESLLIPLGRRLPQEYLLVVGLGDRAGFTEKSFDSCLKKLFDTARGVNRSEIAVALPGRPERECDTLLAIDRFLKIYEEDGDGLEFRIIEPVEAQKVIIPVVERWRLRQLVPQSVKQDKLI